MLSTATGLCICAWITCVCCLRSWNSAFVVAAVRSLSISFFFFFQAEDGIRDLTVTGVQTCALPIYVARSRGGHAIEVTSDRRLTFAGADSVFIAPGATATSDLLEYGVAALSDLALTIQIGAAPADVTGHPGSRTTSYLQAGQWASAAELPAAVTTDQIGRAHV